MSEHKAAIGSAMQEMGERLLAMARQISEGTPAATEAEPRALAQFARAIYTRRRQRAAWFPAAHLGEPAWDLMLDLFAAEFDGRQVSISSACIAAAVPATTALRHIEVMERDGLIERVACPKDRRRVYVQLTEETRLRMAAYLAQYAGGRSTKDTADGRNAPLGHV